MLIRLPKMIHTRNTFTHGGSFMLLVILQRVYDGEKNTHTHHTHLFKSFYTRADCVHVYETSSMLDFNLSRDT